jgi:arylsulfate sulfotransferase
MWILALACSAEPPLRVVDLRLALPDDARVHLVRRLHAVTTSPTRATVTLDDGERRRVIAFPAEAAAHDLPLLGLRPDTAVEVTVALVDEAGREVVETLPLDVGPLDVLVPEALVRTPALAGARSGLVLAAPSAEDPGVSLLVAYDGEGVPVYVAEVEAEHRALGTHLGPAGDLQVSALVGDSLVERDLFGEVVRAFEPTPRLPNSVPVAFVGFHHELRREDDGGVLTLTKEHVAVADYPVDDRDPLGVRRDARIEADVVVALAPDGSTRGTWPLVELLDPQRIGYDATGQLPSGHYVWSHANAVEVDPRDDTLLVSVRHQDAVVKLTRAGEVVWILANPDGWGEAWRDLLLEPVGEPFAWPYHQHAPMATPDGVVLFDNGNHARTTPYSQDPHPDGDWSRVVAYTIDEAAMEVRQAWAFEGDGERGLFSQVVGNADLLPETGHVLATYGWLTEEDGVDNQARGWGRKSVRVIEIAPGSAAAAWDLSLSSRQEDAPQGWGVDRAIAVPSLYGALAEERWE